MAEPVVHHRLRRRPPAGIRNGRALLKAVAGYGIIMLFVTFLGTLIGVKGASGVVLVVAAITLPLAWVIVVVTGLTRTRQKWSFVLVVAVGALISVVVGALIVMMGAQMSDPNATFFAQLMLLPALLLAVGSVWHFSRSVRWFDGTRESVLKPEESGARPITAPLVAGGPAVTVESGPDLAAYGARLGAYVVDAVIVGVVPAAVLVIGANLGGGTGQAATIAGVVLAAVISLGYFPYFWTRNGQTPGMRMQHLQIVRELRSDPLTWGTSIKRYIVFVFGAAALFIGWLWVFVDPRRKAWHDLAAGTIVIRVDPAVTPAEALAAAEARTAPVASDEIERPEIVQVSAEAAVPAHVTSGVPLLAVQGLKKHFPIYGGILRRQIGTVYAVDGVDFEIMPGETFSLVGESGCGKTTLGRTVIQLTPSTDGRVVFDGYELADVDPDDMRPLRRRMQIIFQDPFGSLNPRMPVSDLIGEGLLAQGLTDRNARDRRVEDALELVGLRREYSRRYPHEFSGGQRQRIGVARALALGPDFIVADEPVSALDVSIQSQVLNLLLDLKRDLNLTYLFISHNLSVVQYFSDRVGVMYLGKIVEIGSVEQLYQNPRHPYTVALLSAIPDADPRRRKKRLVLKGDVPSPAAPPSGCRFHTRCWLRERLGNPENCVTEEPSLRTFGGEGHRVACHWAEDISQATVQQAAAEADVVATAVAGDE
jgi:oligopeptide/dipeptide ABC transporter ATP-binding protein